MSEAAYTRCDVVYPAFVNLRQDPRLGLVLTVRGEPNVQNGITFGPGHTSHMFLTPQEARRWLAEAAELVAGVTV